MLTQEELDALCGIVIDHDYWEDEQESDPKPRTSILEIAKMLREHDPLEIEQLVRLLPMNICIALARPIILDIFAYAEGADYIARHPINQ